METNSALCFLGSQTDHGLRTLLSQGSGNTAIIETLVALHAIQSAIKFEGCSIRKFKRQFLGQLFLINTEITSI